MRQISIAVYVSQHVPEEVWQSVVHKHLGQMQAQAVAKGLGTKWKCEYKNGTTTYLVGQDGTEFYIYRQGDRPSDVTNGRVVTAEIASEMSLDEYTQSVKDALRTKAEGKLQSDELDSLLKPYKTVIFMGFSNDLAASEVAEKIIESLQGH